MYHHLIDPNKIENGSYLWQEKTPRSFNELIISFNAYRPTSGCYAIYVRTKKTPWLLYAKWGPNWQSSFSSHGQKYTLKQDIFSLKSPSKQFQIQLLAQDGADLIAFHSLHVCTTSIHLMKQALIPASRASIQLDVPGLSQMALLDPRGNRLCSPTSTTALIRFLKQDPSLDPIEFAHKSWDRGFDLFGNWVFNVAAAYNELQNQGYSCWVERVDSFETILQSLKKEIPVVISVKGPLRNSAMSYTNGHLLVITGYDSTNNEVLCMDPAFASNQKTHIGYPLFDLLNAWKKRGNIAYLFEKTTSLCIG